MLTDFGFETIFEAANGQIAFEKMEQCEMLPSVCVIDVNMPVMDGFETTKIMRQRYPGIKILAFSVNDDANDVVRMLDCGANGYLLKGADPDEIKNAIETIANDGRYFSMGITEIAQEYFQKEKRI